MVGEGGNLGLTQLGRVEYALGGGLIYTDAIDNSAGVDCSDHEVNIKILLDGVVAAGELTTEQRNDVLASMTDDVAHLVLADNDAQTLALVIARRQALPMVNVHARYIDVLESEGWLDRGLEFLPDRQADRRTAGRRCRPAGAGVGGPDRLHEERQHRRGRAAPNCPTIGLLEADLMAYFPEALRTRYAAAVRTHPLRREIIATRLVNQMVNLSGISFDHRMTEDTGGSVVDVTRAWLVAREVLDLPARWAEIDALGRPGPARHPARPVPRLPAAGRAGVAVAAAPPPSADRRAGRRRPVQAGPRRAGARPGAVLVGRMADVVHSVEASRLTAGVPEALAERATVWPLLHTGFDLVELAGTHGTGVTELAAIEWAMFDRLDLSWLWEGIGALPRSDRWQTQARSALRDDMLAALAELTATVVDSAGGSVDAWIAANERAVSRAQAMFTEIRRAETFDMTNLSVALRQLRNLSLTAARGE